MTSALISSEVQPSQKRCFRCQKLQPLSEFWSCQKKNRKGRRNPTCRSCHVARRKEREAKRQEATKACRKCGLEKPLTEFWKCRNFPDGRHPSCILCNHEARQLARRKKKAVRSSSPSARRISRKNAEPVIVDFQFETVDEDATCVYFLQASDGAIKVGYSKNPDSRLARLQLGLYNVTLRKVGQIRFQTQRQAQKVETRFKRRLRPHRIRGEWFRPTAADPIQELLAELLGSERVARFEFPGRSN